MDKLKYFGYGKAQDAASCSHGWAWVSDEDLPQIEAKPLPSADSRSVSYVSYVNKPAPCSCAGVSVLRSNMSPYFFDRHPELCYCPDNSCK